MESLKIIVVVIIALTSLINADQKTIVNKYYIGPKDDFVIECDFKKFSLLVFRPIETIASLLVERQLDNEENYTVIARYFPFAVVKTQQIIPDGRVWEYEFRGGEVFGNRDDIRITVHVKDASCADAGLYRCGLQPEGWGFYRYSAINSLKIKDTIQQGYLTMIPTSGESSLFSKNRVGDPIVMGCTLTFCRSALMRSSWMTFNKLKLNDDKTEALLFCHNKSLSTLSLLNSIEVSSSYIQFTTSTKNIGYLNSDIIHYQFAKLVKRNNKK